MRQNQATRAEQAFVAPAQKLPNDTKLTQIRKSCLIVLYWEYFVASRQ